MAVEIIRHHWCDLCGAKNRVPAEHTDEISIGKVHKRLDTCEDDFKKAVEPLLAALIEFGTPIPREEDEARPGRRAKELKYFCTHCGKGYGSKSGLDGHLDSAHPGTPEPEEAHDPSLVCKDCPEHEPFKTKAGLAGHLRSREHKERSSAMGAVA